MPYSVFHVTNLHRLEIREFETEAEARIYCRTHPHDTIYILIEGTQRETFNRIGTPLAVYWNNTGYNTVPVLQDVAYKTYRLRREKLPSAKGFSVIISDKESPEEERHDRGFLFDSNVRQVWVIVERYRLIAVYSSADPERWYEFRENDTLDGSGLPPGFSINELVPGYSIKVADLFEEITVE